MSLQKILNAALREKGFSDDQITIVQDIIQDVHVVPYDRLAEVVAKRRELEQSEQENLAKLDQLRAERDSMTAEISSLRSELKAVNTRHAVENALLKAGVRHPAFVARAMDLKNVQLSDDGTPIGIDEQIEALRKTDEYLFVSANPTVVPVNPNTPNHESRVAIHGLNPAMDRSETPVQTNETVTDADALYSLLAHRSMMQWR